MQNAARELNLSRHCMSENAKPVVRDYHSEACGESVLWHAEYAWICMQEPTQSYWSGCFVYRGQDVSGADKFILYEAELSEPERRWTRPHHQEVPGAREAYKSISPDPDQGLCRPSFPK